MPLRKCPVCGKMKHHVPAKIRKYKVHYCSQQCQGAEKYTWIGYLVANSPKLSRNVMAEHIGIELTTLRGWISDFKRIGIKLGYKPIATADKKNAKRLKVGTVRIRESRGIEYRYIKTSEGWRVLGRVIPKIKDMSLQRKKQKRQDFDRQTMRKAPKPEPKKLPSKITTFDPLIHKMVRIDSRTYKQVLKISA